MFSEATPYALARYTLHTAEVHTQCHRMTGNVIISPTNILQTVLITREVNGTFDENIYKGMRPYSGKMSRRNFSGFSKTKIFAGLISQFPASKRTPWQTSYLVEEYTV